MTDAIAGRSGVLRDVHRAVEPEIPDADDITPRVGVAEFDGVQPYKLVMIGEKSSLNDVLAPLARQYRADLYLPTGEISDSYIHKIAKIGAEDGRPMRVLYFADCDPSGWQMGISVGRKLQGFRALLYPDLEFALYRVALTPDQVREYGLPVTPLKPEEKRGDRWREAMGVEQTEIDALAALRPDLLRRIATEALDSFFDSTLGRRVFDAEDEWLAAAQRALDGQLDGPRIDALRVEAEAKLSTLRDEIDAINAALRVDVDDFTLPTPVVPEAEVDDEVYGEPLVDSRWPFHEQCRRLIDSKAYGAEES